MVLNIGRENHQDSCIAPSCMDVDFCTLKAFLNGANIGKNRDRINKLSSVGLIRQGITEVPSKETEGMIEIVPTAKGTAFARQVLKVRR
jgi:hypothetical protein